MNEESLSALVDDESATDESRFCLRRLNHDTGTRETWARYHAYGDIMRGQRRVDLVTRVSNALADEASVEIAGGGGWRRPVAGIAVAATVAVAALGFMRSGVQSPSGVDLNRDVRPLAVAGPEVARPVAPTPRASVASGSGQSVEAWNDPRLQAYVMRHNEAAARRGQGLVPYIYLVSTAEEQADRPVPQEDVKVAIGE